MAMFEHVYVIGSTNLPHRYEAMRHELKRVGINDFFPVVDHSTPLKALIRANSNVGGELWGNCAKWDLWLSHYRAIKTAYDLKQDNVLFLEDDCRFRKRLDEVWSGLERAPSDWGVLMLDSFARQNYFPGGHQEQECGWTRIRASWSTACYMVRRSAIERLTEAYERVFDPAQSKWHAIPVDHYITPQYFGDDNPIYAAVPNLAIQRYCGEGSIKEPIYHEAGLDTDMFAPFDVRECPDCTKQDSVIQVHREAVQGGAGQGDRGDELASARQALLRSAKPRAEAVVPVVIESVADWNEFSASVARGAPTKGMIVRLAKDVGPVSTMVGTEEHPFAGVFDGGSNTLTVALSGSDRAIAPFFRVSGATIRDLKVAGTVSGAIHCSGLVGEAFGGPNLIEGCEVAASISSSCSHFGGFIGHSGSFAVTLRGCVFSGSLSSGTYAATFNGWSDDGAVPTLVDCLDVSGSVQPIGRGDGFVYVSSTYYLTSKDFSNDWWRMWDEGKRGKRGYSVTACGGVDPGFGEPLRTYVGSGLAVYPAGLARGGTLYAEAGATVSLRPAFTGAPPAGKKHDSFAASAGEFTQSGDSGSWELAMPGEDVVISATYGQ